MPKINKYVDIDQVEREAKKDFIKNLISKQKILHQFIKLV